MKERDIQKIFGQINKEVGVFELKLAKGKSIPFNAVAEHQIKALMDVKWNGFYHKLTDPPIFSGMRTRFNAKRPFDCFYLKNIPAYVVIAWYIPRKSKEFHYIPISSFVNESGKSVRKSLTKIKSREIARITLMQ